MKMKADEDMDVLEFKIINPKGKEKWAESLKAHMNLIER